MSTAGRFSCESCQKSYSWKPELAGKRVKCKCGVALTVPKTDPASRAVADEIPEGFEDLYALAGPGGGGGAVAEVFTPAPLVTAKCGGCGASMPSGAVLCVNCGHNSATGKKLKTKAVKGGGGGVGGGGVGGGGVGGGSGGGAGVGVLGYMGAGKNRIDESGKVKGDVFWTPADLYIPIALILLGLFCSFFEVRWVWKIESIPVALVAVAATTLVNCVLGFAGILFATRLLDLGLGPILPAVCKTAAAAILPAAAASFVQHVFRVGFYSSYLAWGVSYALSLAIFATLMEMDYQEIVICTTIIWMVRTWVGFAILGLMFGGSSGGGSGMLAGAGGGGGGGSKLRSPSAMMGALGGGGGDPDEPKRPTPGMEFDDHCAQMLGGPGNLDASQWLLTRPKAHFLGRDRTQSLGLVEEAKKLGITNLVAINPTQNPDDDYTSALIGVLPTDPAARKKVFAWYEKLEKIAVFDFTKQYDDGQKQLSIEMME